MPDEIDAFLLRCATKFTVSYDGEMVDITRYTNHGRMVPDGQWAVAWRREFYLLEGRWTYKAYTGFDTPQDALSALRESIFLSAAELASMETRLRMLAEEASRA